MGIRTLWKAEKCSNTGQPRLREQLKTNLPTVFAYQEKQKRVEIQNNAVGIPLIPKLPRAFVPYVKQKKIEIRINAVGIHLNIPKRPRAFVPYVKQKRVNLEIRINAMESPYTEIAEGVQSEKGRNTGHCCRNPFKPKLPRAVAPYVKQKRIGIWICTAADPFTTQVWGFGSPPVFLAPQGRQNWRNTAKTKCGRRPQDARSTLF